MDFSYVQLQVLICRSIGRPLYPTIFSGFYHETQILSWFLPYAHEVIPRGYSEQRVLKEGMFEDLSLANKQLRFVLRFLMVCFLLNRREMVWQLLNQLRVLVDECKRTFQPWVMKRETVIGKKNCHQILTEVGQRNLFVPSKYEGKLWVAKNAKQPVPLLILICEGARAFPQIDVVLLDKRRHDRSPSPSVIVGP
ncbi:hypothetical protein ACFX1Z_035988 [Malus domestica]